MEVAGLILAVVAIMFVGYAVPVWSQRRYAVATSRKDDRFSENLTLLEISDDQSEQDFGPSSRPILNSANVTASRGGTVMSEQTSGVQSRTRAARTHVVGADVRAAQEYSAIRARRAARVSSERVAAKRRLLTAAVGVIAAVIVGVLAAMGQIGWMWIAIPAAFLAATLAASVVAGERTKKLTQAENERMAQLRAQMKRSGRSAAAPVSAPAAPSVPVGEVEEPAAEVAEEIEEEAPVRRVSGGEWDYVPMPKPSYARKAQIRTRTVHADTDIVSVRPLANVSVPGRPTRATAPAASEVVGTSTATNPTFKFDLDAVLEQRRAQ